MSFTPFLDGEDDSGQKEQWLIKREILFGAHLFLLSVSISGYCEAIL